jgi:palmitoyl-protein thioesterase
MHLSIAGYWRNPRDLERYLEKCNYLPLLNNEIHYATKQKENMEVLNNLVLIWSPRDDVLFPPESGKFSTYDRNLGVVPVRETDIYRHDLLGLKYLDESNRFHIYETNCTHVEHRDPICFSQLYSIFKLFLT